MNKKVSELFKKADRYFKTGDFVSSAACYELILRDEKDEFARELAYWGAGESYLEMDELEKSERYLKIATNMNPAEANYHYLLGVTLGKLWRFDEAVGELEIALRLKPDEPELMRHVGWNYFMAGDIVLGRKYLRQALAKDPTYIYTLCDLVSLEMRAQNLEVAGKYLEKACRLDPHDPFVVDVRDAFITVEKLHKKAARKRMVN